MYIFFNSLMDWTDAVIKIVLTLYKIVDVVVILKIERLSAQVFFLGSGAAFDEGVIQSCLPFFKDVSLSYENIGTLNVRELFWMLRCNLNASVQPYKSDESTFFVLNVDWIFVRHWVLPYINENAKRSDASILMLYIHFPLPFPVTFGAS